MHAWDTETWSVVSTATVAVVALTVTGLSGWRDRVHARHLAREERRQDRIERTYAEVLTYLSRPPLPSEPLVSGPIRVWPGRRSRRSKGW